jgi:uncharacterized Ntn-hydrolase superfamily protein
MPYSALLTPQESDAEERAIKIVERCGHGNAFGGDGRTKRDEASH